MQTKIDFNNHDNKPSTPTTTMKLINADDCLMLPTKKKPVLPLINRDLINEVYQPLTLQTLDEI